MNRKFSTVAGVAAPLLMDDVNTDLIIPIEHCVSTPRSQFGKVAFEAIRYLSDGSDNPDFVLNRQPYSGAPILVTGSNFGCGSSREPAVWAIDQLGIRVIIARSFGDIFHANCLRNNILPIALSAAVHDSLADIVQHSEAPTELTVDLEQCVITAPHGTAITFEIDPARQQALMQGLDELDQTLLSLPDIVMFQKRDRVDRPWVWSMPPSARVQKGK